MEYSICANKVLKIARLCLKIARLTHLGAKQQETNAEDGTGEVGPQQGPEARDRQP